MKTAKFWRAQYDDACRAIRETMEQIKYKQYDGPEGLDALDFELCELRAVRAEAWAKYRRAAAWAACGVS